MNMAPKTITKAQLPSWFWASVFENWCTYHYINQEAKVCKSVLYKSLLIGNDMILLGGSTISATQANYLGKHKIEDMLLGQDKHIPTFQELQTSMNLQGNRLMLAHSIISALPSSWKSIINGDLSFLIKDQYFRYDYVNIPGKMTRMIYQQLTYRELSHVHLAAKWQEKIGISISPIDMDTAFAAIKELALATKYRDFQFRFLHRCIFTNKILYVWKISDTDRCTYCHDEYETIEHLFYSCHIVKRFWELFSNWYEAMTDTILNLTLERIVFCFEKKDDESVKITILDTLILMAKQFIYRNRCMENPPGFSKFKEEMFYICKIERSLAYRENKTKKFSKKWGLFLK